MTTQILLFNPFGLIVGSDHQHILKPVDLKNETEAIEFIQRETGFQFTSNQIMGYPSNFNGKAMPQRLFAVLDKETPIPETFQVLDLKTKSSLTKEQIREVCLFIEWARLNHEPIDWLKTIESQFFDGSLPYFTPQYLGLICKKGEQKAREQKLSSRALKLSLALPLLLGFAMDYLFYTGRLGLSVTVFFLFLFFLIYYQKRRLTLNAMTVMLGIGALGLAFSFALFNNSTLRVLNTLMMPFATTACLVSFFQGEWKPYHMGLISHSISQVTVKPIGALVKLWIPLKKVMPVSDIPISKSVKQISLGLALATPILMIIISLLAGADQVFQLFLDNLFQFDWSQEWAEFVSHLVFIGFCSLYFFGYLWQLNIKEQAYSEPRAWKTWLESTTVKTLLGAILLVYLGFAYIQIRYLFLGGALPDGFSYADYARQGFFELVAVTGFNGLIIILVNRYANKQEAKDGQVVNHLLSLLIGFSYLLLYTGFYRMFLYEGTYGYTELRLFVLFFMAFMGLSLAVLLLWIWKPQVSAFKWIAICGISVYLVLNYINVDALIAERNINRSQDYALLDTYHMTQLSVDALEVIAVSLRDHPDYDRILESFIENNMDELNRVNSWYDYNRGMSAFAKFLQHKD